MIQEEGEANAAAAALYIRTCFLGFRHVNVDDSYDEFRRALVQYVYRHSLVSLINFVHKK